MKDEAHAAPRASPVSLRVKLIVTLSRKEAIS